MAPRKPVCVDTAAALLREGAVVAYPTEAVWGLGCDPRDEAAVLRLLALKRREVGKGLILIAGEQAQLDPFLAWDRLDPQARARVLASWPGPHTWIVPASEDTPTWIRGDHAGVAVRVSAHPQVVALCAAFGGALVSTSANPAGLPPPHSHDALDPAILAGIDAVLEGETSGLDRPSIIRDARSGDILRG